MIVITVWSTEWCNDDNGLLEQDSLESGSQDKMIRRGYLRLRVPLLYYG